MTALHEAAALLIAEASPATVRQVLRLLLDDPPQPAKVRPSGNRRVALDAEWRETVGQVKAAIAARGLTRAAVAKKVGLQPGTVTRALRLVSASAATRRRFRAWLAEPVVPAVTAPAPPFRRRGHAAKPATNGATPTTA